MGSILFVLFLFLQKRYHWCGAEKKNKTCTVIEGELLLLSCMNVIPGEAKKKTRWLATLLPIRGKLSKQYCNDISKIQWSTCVRCVHREHKSTFDFNFEKILYFLLALDSDPFGSENCKHIFQRVQIYYTHMAATIIYAQLFDYYYTYYSIWDLVTAN